LNKELIFSQIHALLAHRTS